MTVFVATTGGSAIVVTAPQGVAGNQLPVVPHTINSGGAQAYTAPAGTYLYIDLGATGGNVTVNPVGIGVGPLGLSVKLINATGGFVCFINPMVAGSHIENRAAPGTLNAQMTLLTQGDEVTLGSNDAINLWY
jgi:hypothetical protein